MQAYIQRGAWYALHALLLSAPVLAQSAAASDGVSRSAGPADPSDDLVPAGKHFSLAAAKALPPLGAEGEAGPYLFGLSEADIIAAALAAKPDRVDLDLVLERMRKPFDASKFGTLHHAVGRDGMLRIQYRVWELLLAGIPQESAQEEARRLIDREREAYFQKMYPVGIPDDDPYWGILIRADGSQATAAAAGCGSEVTVEASGGQWRLKSESHDFMAATWETHSHATAQRRRSLGPVKLWWNKHDVDSIAIHQDGAYHNWDPQGREPVAGSWIGVDFRNDVGEAEVRKAWDFRPSEVHWTSEATASDWEFGTLSAMSCWGY